MTHVEPVIVRPKPITNDYVRIDKEVNVLIDYTHKYTP